MEKIYHREDPGIICTAFNGQRPLSYRRKAQGTRQDFRDPLPKPQPFESGHRQNNGVILRYKNIIQSFLAVVAVIDSIMLIFQSIYNDFVQTFFIFDN